MGIPPLLAFGMSLCHSDPIHAPSQTNHTSKLQNSYTPKLLYSQKLHCPRFMRRWSCTTAGMKMHNEKTTARATFVVLPPNRSDKVAS